MAGGGGYGGGGFGGGGLSGTRGAGGFGYDGGGNPVGPGFGGGGGPGGDDDEDKGGGGRDQGRRDTSRNTARNKANNWGGIPKGDVRTTGLRSGFRQGALRAAKTRTKAELDSNQQDYENEVASRKELQKENYDRTMDRYDDAKQETAIKSIPVIGGIYSLFKGITGLFKANMSGAVPQGSAFGRGLRTASTVAPGIPGMVGGVIGGMVDYAALDKEQASISSRYADRAAGRTIGGGSMGPSRYGTPVGTGSRYASNAGSRYGTRAGAGGGTTMAFAGGGDGGGQAPLIPKVDDAADTKTASSSPGWRDQTSARQAASRAALSRRATQGRYGGLVKEEGIL